MMNGSLSVWFAPLLKRKERKIALSLKTCICEWLTAPFFLSEKQHYRSVCRSVRQDGIVDAASS